MDCHGLQIAFSGEAGSAGSDDQRISSRGYVCRGSHPPGASDIPGVFSGIGEFTIHKEFVSSKVSGETASLTNPALDKILDFAGEVGLVVIIHNDIDAPFPSPDQEPFALLQMKQLFRRHPKTRIIWAHVGVGRVVRPFPEQAALIERALNNPELSHVYFDLSWDEVAKYAVATPENTKRVADVINAISGSLLVWNRRRCTKEC